MPGGRFPGKYKKVCANCGKDFHAPGAESLAFNSAGACPACAGTGIVREVNRAALVPDESKSIDEARCCHGVR